MSGDFNLDSYNTVPERIAEFRAKYPDGSLRPANPNEPVKIRTIGDKVFLEYVAEAYRGPEDTIPGIGVAWEPFPGRTPYTRDSEAQNAETSAWGRAIVAALAADTKKGIASAEEVRNRRAEPEPEPDAFNQPDPRIAVQRQILAAATSRGWVKEDVIADYAASHNNADIKTATMPELQAYLAVLNEPAEAGVTA